MIKIRKLQAKDRLALYKLLQQNEQLNQQEIELELSYIDEALFNKSHSKVWVVIALTDQQRIGGYASYGVVTRLKNTFVIFNIIVSPLAKDQGIEGVLLEYIERDILKKQGRLILAEIPSENSFEPTRNFFAEHHYSLDEVSNSYKEYHKNRHFYKKEI